MSNKRKNNKKKKKIRELKKAQDTYGVLKIKEEVEKIYGYEVTIYRSYFFKISDSEKALDIYPKNKRYLRCSERRWGNYTDIFELIEDYFELNIKYRVV